MLRGRILDDGQDEWRGPGQWLRVTGTIVAPRPTVQNGRTVTGEHETCWTLIRRAATGEHGARSLFTHSYQRLIRAYLEQRWRGTPLAADVDDACQEVLLECFGDAGPLQRADAGREFRSFLLGIVRNIALRFERQRGRRREQVVGGNSAFAEVATDEEQLSRFFDRQWAQNLVDEARRTMQAEAATGDPRAKLHAELLELRFGAGLPIRDIAARWQMDPDAVHRAYGKARERFRACLRQVVSFHVQVPETDLDAECQRVVELLAKG